MGTVLPMHLPRVRVGHGSWCLRKREGRQREGKERERKKRRRKGRKKGRGGGDKEEEEKEGEEEEVVEKEGRGGKEEEWRRRNMDCLLGRVRADSTDYFPLSAQLSCRDAGLSTVGE